MGESAHSSSTPENNFTTGKSREIMTIIRNITAARERGTTTRRRSNDNHIVVVVIVVVGWCGWWPRESIAVGGRRSGRRPCLCDRRWRRWVAVVFGSSPSSLLARLSIWEGKGKGFGFSLLSLLLFGEPSPKRHYFECFGPGCAPESVTWKCM